MTQQLDFIWSRAQERAQGINEPRSIVGMRLQTTLPQTPEDRPYAIS